MLFPESREQVEAIVAKAREKGRALVPLSSGAPHFHGASVNPQAETVCFSRMNNIMKIDRRSRYARVEAGVTFGQLIPALAEAGMRLNAPFLPRANKSVVASMLEREAVVVPKYQYDYTDPLLNVEVICGNGELFRTGSAAGPGPIEELKADMCLPWGPGSIDFLRFFTGAQGTMGLVTWATLKTEILPSISNMYFIIADTVERLISLANGLLLNRVLDDCVILNRVNLAAAFADSSREEAELASEVPEWVMLCRISGFERYPEERIAIYEEMLMDACAKAGMNALRELPGCAGLAEKVGAMLGNCDSREPYWKLRRGAEREIDFLAPPSKTPKLAEMLSGLEDKCGGALGITIQPQVQGRAYRLEADVFFDGKSPEVTEQAFTDILPELHDAGAYFDRPYGEMSKLVYTDPVSVEALRKLKAIYDPDGILNPGKLCFNGR